MTGFTVQRDSKLCREMGYSVNYRCRIINTSSTTFLKLPIETSILFLHLSNFFEVRMYKYLTSLQDTLVQFDVNLF